MRPSSLTSVLLLTLAPALAQEPDSRRPIALQDYWALHSVGSPAISPDGTRVAFVRTVPLEEDNRSHSAIWLVAADGSADPRRLTSPSFSSSAPVWSPDGKLLAFRSARTEQETGDRESTWFLRMDGAGGEAFRIPGIEGSPIFSPDGSWIAFTKETPPEGGDDPEVSELERTIEERFDGKAYDWMSYRFDRRGYLKDPRDPRATPPEELWVVPRGGGEARRLTDLGVDVGAVAWRPDGRALVFTADAHQRDEYVYPRPDLWTVDLEGKVTRLTEDDYRCGSPEWSPDGTWIAFTRSHSTNMVLASGQRHGGPVDLCRIPAGGGAIDNLTESWNYRPRSPVWIGDGSSILFQDSIAGTSHLYRLLVAARQVEPVTSGPRRSLRSFSFARSSPRFCYTATDSAHPAEVYAARLDGTEERRLTAVNDTLLADLRLSEARRIQYNSADGTPIEGWVLPPPGRAGDAARAPLILSIHGGPHGAYGESFSFTWQLWAAQGYWVLYTNPRGSTGYGEDFLWAIWGAWGDLDMQDLMAGVDWAVANHPIDPQRLGVTGGSYGGFMTNWIITHTDRFAAAIARASISNWISDYGTCDIPHTKETEFFGPPWSEKGRKTLVRQSPITYVDRAVTPTLFLHGELDYRTPIEQAEQMYVALKKRRVPARFVRYPDSYHGGWTHWRSVHRHLQELKWWEQWLQAPRQDR